MKAKVPAAIRSGSSFISFIHEWGHPEWVVLAAEAPLDSLAKELGAITPARQRWKNVPVRAATPRDNEIAPWLALVQLTDSPWTVALRLLCLPLDERDITTAEKEALKLSAKLRTRTVVFVGEDTSGGMYCSLYERGRCVSMQDWETQGEAIDSVFARLGLLVPACYPVVGANGAELVLASQAASLRIERADVLDSPGE